MQGVFVPSLVGKLRFFMATATCRPVEDPDGGLHSEPAQEEAQDESELSLGLERTEGTLRMGVGELRVPSGGRGW